MTKASPVRRTVAVNAGSIFFGRLISALSIWFALVILAKLSDPATVGIYALAQAICIPIADVAKLGLKEVRSSDVEHEYSTANYLHLRLIMTGVAFALSLLTGAWQADSSTVLIVIGVYALVRAAEMLSDFAFGHFQLVERMDYIGRSMCISGPLALIALSLGYYLSGSLVVAVLGQLGANLLVLLLHDLPISQRLGRTDGSDPARQVWSPAKVRSLARISLHMGFATALIMIAVHFPRLWVGHELGLAALGIFGPIVALVLAPDRLVSALCMALSVRLARFYREGQVGKIYVRLGQVVAALLVVGLPGIAACATYGETILRLVYTEEFALHSDLLVFLAAASLMRIIGNVLGFGVIAARAFWWLMLQNAAVAVVALVSCVTLIGRFGLVGASYALMLTFGTHLLFALGGLLVVRRQARGREAQR